MSDTPPASERDALRIQLGLSTAELARRADISVDTVRKILKGQEGQATKVKAVDEALARAGQDRGIDATVVTSTSERSRHGGHALVEEDLMEFEVGGNFGVSVVVRGPVKDHEALETAVLKLIQGMNRGGPPAPEPQPEPS
jgi:transcriptional regulator with XRE-family HTH domain